MTQSELAHEIALGLINTGIEGGYESVSCSTAGDYPSLGCSQWEGGRADDLLERIPGGDKFIDRPYSDIEAAGEVDELASLISSDAGQAAQLAQLESDCVSYVETLTTICDFDDSRCVIYAGMWCPTSAVVVARFIRRRRDRGYNIRSLGTIRDMFRDEYADAAEIPTGCYAGYENRANSTFDYVSSLDLTPAYGVPEYGNGEFGR